MMMKSKNILIITTFRWREITRLRCVREVASRALVVNSKNVLTTILFLCSLSLTAQTVDIQSLAKAKPFKISGGVSADMMYSESDIPTTWEEMAFQYFLKGNLTASIYGQISIPVSFSYSNREFDTRYPKNFQNFNRFGVSPKYKWITVHGGWRNMRFSKYSLNGHTFLGGGIELTPGDFEIKLMHGRLLKGVKPDTTVNSPGNKPAFERWGSGLQVVHKNKGNKYGFSIFRSADNYASIEGGLDSLGITPEENFVASVQIAQKINNFISLKLEYASSQITEDNRTNIEGNTFFKDNIYFNKNNSTKNTNAINSNLDFQINKMSIGVGYERVEPEFRTHGAYFYNNDFENVTLNFASPFLKEKLNFSSSFGFERDNVGKTKTSTSNRLIGQANLSWIATEKLQFNTSYSNFRNITEFNPYANIQTTINPYDNVDSLRFVQVSQNTSLNMTYNTQSETLGQSVSVMLSMMQTDAELGGEVQNSGADFYSSNVAYNLNFIPYALSVTTSANFNWAVMQEQENGMFGPSLGINTKIFKAVNTGVMYTWNMPVGDGQNSGNIQRLQYTASYTLNKKHSFNLSAVWMNKEMIDSNQEKKMVNNYLVRFGYAYKF